MYCQAVYPYLVNVHNTSSIITVLIHGKHMCNLAWQLRPRKKGPMIKSLRPTGPTGSGLASQLVNIPYTPTLELTTNHSIG